MNLSTYNRLGKLLGRKPRQQMLTHFSDGEFQWLMGEYQKSWRQTMRTLERSGDPVALTGGFAGLEYKPLSDALSPVNFVSGAFAPFTATTYTPVFANAANERSPVHFSLFWAASVGGGSSPGTLQVGPNLFTSSSTSSGALGTSQASGTLLPSGNGLMYVRFELTVRGTGSGTDGRAYGTGTWTGKITAAYASGSATNSDTSSLLGGSAITFDSTANNGLWMTLTGTATTATITTQQLVWSSWN